MERELRRIKRYWASTGNPNTPLDASPVPATSYRGSRFLTLCLDWVSMEHSFASPSRPQPLGRTAEQRSARSGLATVVAASADSSPPETISNSFDRGEESRFCSRD